MTKTQIHAIGCAIRNAEKTIACLESHSVIVPPQAQNVLRTSIASGLMGMAKNLSTWSPEDLKEVSAINDKEVVTVILQLGNAQ